MWNYKPLIDTFNQEKALVGVFSVIEKFLGTLVWSSTSQRGGAGEGLVQNPGLGEEVDSVFQTPGIVSNPFYSLVYIHVIIIKEI